MTYCRASVACARFGLFMSMLTLSFVFLTTQTVAESANTCKPPYGYFDPINIANHFGLKQGDLYWNPFQDLNKDLIIDIYDAIIFASSFAEFGFWG